VNFGCVQSGRPAAPCPGACIIMTTCASCNPTPWMRQCALSILLLLGVPLELRPGSSLDVPAAAANLRTEKVQTFPFSGCGVSRRAPGPHASHVAGTLDVPREALAEQRAKGVERGHHSIYMVPLLSESSFYVLEERVVEQDACRCTVTGAQSPCRSDWLTVAEQRSCVCQCTPAPTR
jgi:hypothetical protein